MLILRCHLRHVLVGANMRPPRHMLPNAPAKPDGGAGACAGGYAAPCGSLAACARNLSVVVDYCGSAGSANQSWQLEGVAGPEPTFARVRLRSKRPFGSGRAEFSPNPAESCPDQRTGACQWPVLAGPSASLAAAGWGGERQPAPAR